MTASLVVAGVAGRRQNAVAGGEVVVPLNGVSLAPGERDTLEVRFDAEVTAPATLFALTVSATGIGAMDGNLMLPVTVAPEAGSEFPLSSGFAQLSTPARTLVAAFALACRDEIASRIRKVHAEGKHEEFAFHQGRNRSKDAVSAFLNAMNTNTALNHRGLCSAARRAASSSNPSSLDSSEIPTRCSRTNAMSLTGGR